MHGMIHISQRTGAVQKEPCFCAYLILLSTLSRFTYVFIQVHLFCHERLTDISSCALHILFFCFSFDTHLGYFHFLRTIEGAVMSTGLLISVWDLVPGINMFIYWGRVSHLSLKLIGAASLARQLVSGTWRFNTSNLCLPMVGIIGWQGHECQGAEFEPSCLHSKWFTH